MNKIYHDITSILKNAIPIYKFFAKWLIIGSFIGVVIGLFGTLFYYLVETATMIRTENTWIILLLPIAGVAIIAVYSAMNYKRDKGTNLVLLTSRSSKQMYLKHTFCIFISTIITHMFGGSSGREGAALQIGGSIGSFFGRVLRLSKKEKRVIVMCGMSAGFATLFGTPITAAFFAMEIAFIGVVHYSAIVPCIVSAVIGSRISHHLGAVHFNLSVIVPEFTLKTYIKVVLLAVMCSILSQFFCISHKLVSKVFNKVKNQYLRIAIGGSIVVLLTFGLRTFDYNGAGSNIISKAFITPSEPEVFMLKILFTLITLVAGYKGGEIIPIFFIGATFGSFFGNIIGFDCSFGAALGIVGLFCGVTNCPLASILLSFELLGTEGIIFYAICCAIAYTTSGTSGLYSKQKILFSKQDSEVMIEKIF